MKDLGGKKRGWLKQGGMGFWGKIERLMGAIKRTQVWKEETAKIETREKGAVVAAADTFIPLYTFIGSQHLL